MGNRYRLCSGTAVFAFVALALLLGPNAVFALGVSPGAVVQGDATVLTISTPGEQWTPGVTVDLGDYLVVGDVAVVTPELLQVSATATSGAPLGPRDVTVQQEERVVVGVDALQVVGQDEGAAPSHSGPLLDVNVMTNPGFETGDMTGWIPSTWSISTVQPHGGTYDAYDPGGSGGGGLCIRQDFDTPIDSNTITSFSFWLRQLDDAGIAQVAVYHQNAGTQYGVAFTNNDDSWTFEDFTSLVRPNDLVTAIHICGFGGGYSTPDDSWADDFEMMIEDGGTPVEQTTWGHLKSIHRR